MSDDDWADLHGYTWEEQAQDEYEGMFEGVVNRIVERVPKPPTPYPLLYHYTTGNSLIQILTNRCILASHYKYLNDRSELIYVLEVVDRWLASVTDPVERALAEAIRGKFNESLSDLSLEPFVTCFSRDGDSLSQWRAYADDGSGYAIGLDPNLLPDYYLVPPEFDGYWLSKDNMVPVTYSHDLHSTLFMEGIREMLQFIRELDSRSRDDGFRWMNNLLMTFGPQIKNPKFSEEQEWRFWIWHWRDKHEPAGRKLHFRASPFGVVPAMRLNIAHGEVNPIREIVVGPKLDLTTARYGLHCLLEQSGFSGVTIRKSDASYR